MRHQNPLGTKELTFCNRFCQVTLASELAMKGLGFRVLGFRV